MRQIIKQDILEVLKGVIGSIKTENYEVLPELSNHTIHDASVFQEEDSLTLAVLVYALSKCISRCIERKKPVPLFVSNLETAERALLSGDEDNYRKAIRSALREVRDFDSQLGLYVQEVIEQARIKKASKIHEHGISLARTAELLGISQWELQGYVGKTVMDLPRDGIGESERLRKARELFR